MESVIKTQRLTKAPIGFILIFCLLTVSGCTLQNPNAEGPAQTIKSPDSDQTELSTDSSESPKSSTFPSLDFVSPGFSCEDLLTNDALTKLNWISSNGSSVNENQNDTVKNFIEHSSLNCLWVDQDNGGQFRVLSLAFNESDQAKIESYVQELPGAQVSPNQSGLVTTQFSGKDYTHVIANGNWAIYVQETPGDQTKALLAEELIGSSLSSKR